MSIKDLNQFVQLRRQERNPDSVISDCLGLRSSLKDYCYCVKCLFIMLYINKDAFNDMEAEVA